MKTIITEEYDSDGKLTKRTTVTEGDHATGGYLIGPAFPGTLSACTCSQPWGSITAPPPCPVHGQAQPATITCSSNTSPESLAERVGFELRRAS